MERVLTSAKFNSLSIEAVAGEVVMISADMVAQDETINTAPEDPELPHEWGLYDYDTSTVFPDVPLFVFHHGAVKIGNTAKDVDAFKVSINNNIIDDAYGLGSRTVYTMPIQKREITINIDMQFDSETEYKRFFGGKATPDATSPADCMDEFELDLTLTSCDFIGGGSSDYYRLQLYFPKTLWNTTGGPNMSGRDRLMYSLESSQCMMASATELAALSGNPTLTGYTDGGGTPPTTYAMVALLDNDALTGSEY